MFGHDGFHMKQNFFLQIHVHISEHWERRGDDEGQFYNNFLSHLED